MSYLIVLTFDGQEGASEVREILGQQQRGGYVKLDDSAVVVRASNPTRLLRDLPSG